MKVIICGKPKEIVALALNAQEQLSAESLRMDTDAVAKCAVEVTRHLAKTIEANRGNGPEVQA